MNQRIKSLDFLRGIAILLVMLRHSGLSTITTRMGWIGVDLFFVLSGFLVSGLLFSEYQKTKQIRPVRFLIRRGFKIYPLFYTTLLLHISYFIAKDLPLHTNEILPEIFFYQNYKPGIIGISWSLAIEEHFYLLLSLGLLILYKTGKIGSKKIIPALLLFVAVACLVLRIIVVLSTNVFDSYRQFFPTHLRIDSLSFGVFIAWLYYFEKEKLSVYVFKYKLLLLLIIPLLLLPPFFAEPESFLITTTGFTMLYLGFGILLTFMLLYAEEISIHLQKNSWLNLLFSLFAWIGAYSYSIYLIHMKAGPMLSNYINITTGSFLPKYLIIALSISLNILTGWFLSLLIEKPFLKLREKYFPANK